MDTNHMDDRQQPPWACELPPPRRDPTQLGEEREPERLTVTPALGFAAKH